MVCSRWTLRICLLVAFCSQNSRSDDDCDWPRIDGSQLTQEEFDSTYYEKQPVILGNLWETRASHGFWDKAPFLRRYGKHAFRSSHISRNTRLMLEIADGTMLEDYMNASGSSGPSLFIYPNHPLVQKVLEDYNWTYPGLVKHIGIDGPFLSIGNEQQGNVFHAHENNIFVQFHGRKRWLVLPKKHMPRIDVFMARVREPCAPNPGWRGMSSCIVKAGEILYLPSQLQHETCSLDSFNVGMTLIGTIKNKLLIPVRTQDLAALELELLQQSTKDNLNEMLTAASKFGHERVVDRLLKQGAEVNSLGDAGYSPLHAAAMGGHAAIAKVLMQKGAKLSSKNKQGETPWQSAVKTKDCEVLELFAESGQARTMMKDAQQAADLVARDGHPSCVELFLEHKDAKVSASQLLATACKYGHARVAELLMHYRADISAAVKDEEYAEKGRIELSHLASIRGHARILRFLAEKRANLEARSEQGFRPAHFAAFDGHSNALEYLAESGTSLEPVVEDIGLQPLHLAIYNGHTVVVQFLSERQVDLTVRDPQHGLKPIELAKKQGYKTMVKLLKNAKKVASPARKHQPTRSHAEL